MNAFIEKNEKIMKNLRKNTFVSDNTMFSEKPMVDQGVGRVKVVKDFVRIAVVRRCEDDYLEKLSEEGKDFVEIRTDIDASLKIRRKIREL